MWGSGGIKGTKVVRITHLSVPDNAVGRKDSLACKAQSEPSAQSNRDLIATKPAGRWNLTLLIKQAVATASAGAVLGPLCDGLHSSHDVLHYSSPTLFKLGDVTLLESCWWVPILFGIAGTILGVSHPVLDDWQREQASAQDDAVKEPATGWAPAWPAVVLGISAFVLQYNASGELAAPLSAQQLPVLGSHGLDAGLAAAAVATYVALDGTKQGLFMAALTAVAGPAVEIFLINQLGLYHYTHPDIWGVPTWIPWVYFSGSPAVGTLGRRVRATLVEQLNSS